MPRFDKNHVENILSTFCQWLSHLVTNSEKQQYCNITNTKKRSGMILNGVFGSSHHYLQKWTQKNYAHCVWICLNRSQSTKVNKMEHKKVVHNCFKLTLVVWMPLWNKHNKNDRKKMSFLCLSMHWIVLLTRHNKKGSEKNGSALYNLALHCKFNKIGQKTSDILRIPKKQTQSSHYKLQPN